MSIHPTALVDPKARLAENVSIGPYVVDFASHEAKLVIEVDGGQHDRASPKERARTRRIQGDGFRVIRFWNSEVLGNIEGVVMSIEAELAAHPQGRAVFLRLLARAEQAVR